MDALRSVTISQQLLGTTEIYVVHHTGGCWAGAAWHGHAHMGRMLCGVASLPR